MPAEIDRFGQPKIVEDAAIPDRQSALMYAYHFGTELAELNQILSRQQAYRNVQAENLENLKEELAAGTSSPEEYVDTKARILYTENSMNSSSGSNWDKKTRQAEASLVRMFSFTDNGLRNEGTEFVGITIEHGEYGKLMEISAEGEITMFDSAGKAYTRQEFLDAQPDGMIPQLHNDLKREAEREEFIRKREQFARDNPDKVRYLSYEEGVEATLERYRDQVRADMLV